MNPLIRWAGSKRQAIATLKPYWELSGKQKYLEPFCGSAALFFEIDPTCAYLNDSNKALINAYRQIRSSPRKVHTAVSALTNDPDTYYRIRSQSHEGLSGFDKAVRFLYLNRYCFNGIYRENKKGHFNVPYGGQKVGNLPSEYEFRKGAKMLRSAKLFSVDFEDFIRANLTEGSFVYLDPPYAVSNVRTFRQYSPSSFGISDLDRLFDVLEHIEKNGAFFLLSYAESEELDIFSSRWPQIKYSVKRHIAGFSRHRKRVAEVLISNLQQE